MAFATTTEWDVRTTGSDGNGGGFNTASSGTDYSVQDAPQVTYTDLVIDGTTNTKCTSAGHPFTSAHVGNIINITSGTGFTVQRVQVNSVTSGVATCDKSLGTLSSTGGNGVLGGGLATVQTAGSLWGSIGKIWIKTGTYTLTSTFTIGNLSASAYIIGYGSAHGDFGTAPLITTSTNSTILFKISQGNGTAQLSFNFANLSMSNTASTRADGVEAQNGNGPGYFYRCVFDGFVEAINPPGGSAFEPTLVMDECEVKNCTSNGVRNRAGGAGNLILVNCFIHDNVGNGIQQEGGNYIVIVGCIIAANGGDGFAQANNGTNAIAYTVERNTFAGNTGNGIKFGSTGGGQSGASFISFKNNICYGNGAYGVNCNVAPNFTANRNNAYGANTTAARLNLPVGVSDVTLTADPFTNSAGRDYSLNLVSGGGLLVRGTGYQIGV